MVSADGMDVHPETSRTLDRIHDATGIRALGEEVAHQPDRPRRIVLEQDLEELVELLGASVHVPDDD